MSEALPLALMALLVVLLAAMPWHRPHPNHQFMLKVLRLLEEDEQTNSSDSSLTHVQSTTREQLRSVPSSGGNDKISASARGSHHLLDQYARV
jgi:hypothetical protein